MRIVGALAILLLLMGVSAWEWNWRAFQPAIGKPVVSPSGDYVAQFRFLDEGSAAPYGQGVFLRNRYLPLWATSKLVFAAYCKPGEKLHWRDTSNLMVECVVAEGAPKVFSTPNSILITHNGGA